MSHPVRICIGCATFDDHPRHNIVNHDGTDSPMHLDCCAIARNCESCRAQLEGVGGVEGNPKGEALREHLIATGPGADQPGWTAPTLEG
jgi:hypothetical protein